MSELHTHVFDSEKTQMRGIAQIVVGDSELQTSPTNYTPTAEKPDGGLDGWMTVAGS